MFVGSLNQISPDSRSHAGLVSWGQVLVMILSTILIITRIRFYSFCMLLQEMGTLRSDARVVDGYMAVILVLKSPVQIRSS